jgi:hypothetical protein
MEDVDTELNSEHQVVYIKSKTEIIGFDDIRN